MLASIGSFMVAKARDADLCLIRNALTGKNIIDLKDGQKVVVFGQIFPVRKESIILSPFQKE